MYLLHSNNAVLHAARTDRSSDSRLYPRTMHSDVDQIESAAGHYHYLQYLDTMV